MKKEHPRKRGNNHPSAENKRNHSGPTGSAPRHLSTPDEGPYGIGENQASQDYSSTDSSNRNKGRDQDPVQTNDTPANEKTGRGYQDMNNRNLEQDYNKDLDEDVINHYDSKTGFDESDEYSDEDVESEGNDQEYNSRYNDDRNEENEREELHTDTDISRNLTEKEMSAEPAPKGKRKPSTAVTNKYRPIGESGDESQNNPVDQDRLKKATRATSEKKKPSASSGKKRKR
jgi:hypothetical protein